MTNAKFTYLSYCDMINCQICFKGVLMDPVLYEASRQRLVRLSRNFGIAALLFALMFSAFFPVIIGFACLSILLAFLSKGGGLKIDSSAKVGVTAGVIAMIISVTVLLSGVLRLYTNAEYRESFISTSEALYGDTYRELYGIDIGDLINSVFGGKGQ